MAEGARFHCDHCHHEIESWSDGNPYLLNEKGEKEYAYHPDHDRLALTIGNDSPHLCLACGEKQMVDSRSPHDACTRCGAERLVDTWNLGGEPCPLCRNGHFRRDETFRPIS